jgi:Flp pilus assembly pilin Flp
VNSSFAHFLRNDSGTAVVEYSIVLAVFGVAMIGVLQSVFNTSGNQLSSTQTHLQNTSLSLPVPNPTPTGS